MVLSTYTYKYLSFSPKVSFVDDYWMDRTAHIHLYVSLRHIVRHSFDFTMIIELIGDVAIYSDLDLVITVSFDVDDVIKGSRHSHLLSSFENSNQKVCHLID